MKRFLTQDNLKIIIFVILAIIITFQITKHIYTVDDYMPRAKINDLQKEYGRDIVEVQDYINNNTLNLSNYIKDVTKSVETKIRDEEYLKCKDEINECENSCDGSTEAVHGGAKLTKNKNG